MPRPDRARPRRPSAADDRQRVAGDEKRGSAAETRWVWVALGALVLFAYANAIPLGLAVDAPFLLSMDRLSAPTVENLRLVFTRPYWWPLHSDDLYRPVTLLSFLLGPGGVGRPWLVHAVNVALHAVNVVLVFRLAARQHRAVVPALTVAALFAVHPMGTDVVTNVAGRADLLAAGSLLGGVLIHARLREGVRRRAAWLVLLALVALAGVFAKENAMVLLPVLLLHDFARASTPGVSFKAALRESWRGGWASYGVVAAAVAALFGARAAVFAGELPHWQPFVDNPLSVATPLAARATALEVFGWSTLQLVWPAAFSADYSYDQIPVIGPDAPVGRHLAWMVTLAALAASAVWAYRGRAVRPALFFWLFFFLGTRLPTANVLMPIGSIFGERFLYVPMIGVFGVGAALLFPRGGGVASRGLRAAVAAVVIALGLRTMARNRDWRDDETIWRSATRVCPDSYKPYKGLAKVRMQRGEIDEAIALYERSLAILDKRPLDPADRSSDLLSSAGEAYLAKGDRLSGTDAASARAFFEKARQVLRRAAETDRASNDRLRRLRERRGDAAGEIRDVGIPRIHHLRGLAARRLGDGEEAAEAFAWQRHLDPTRAPAYRELAETARLGGRHADEAMFLVEALILEPDDAGVWQALPAVMAREGIRGLGREGGRIRIDPQDPPLASIVARACPDLVSGLRRSGREAQAREAEGICMRNLGYRAR